MEHRKDVYVRHMGDFGNLTRATPQQHQAEASLHAAGLSGFDLLFGPDIR